MIEEGLSANEIKLKLEQAKQKMAIFIAVDDLKFYGLHENPIPNAPDPVWQVTPNDK